MENPNPKEKEDIENKIIDWIDKGAGDRLIIFKPEKNNGTVDLTVKKKGEYKGKEISFKVEGLIGPGDNDNFAVEILQEDFEFSKDFYLMFVYFNEIKQDIENIWVIPSITFRDIIEPFKLSGNKIVLRFESSTDNKKDKYINFLVDKKELGGLLLEIIEVKGNFDFSKSAFKENKTINPDRLKKFIIEARENTYAKSAKPVDNPRILGSKQLEYQKADYFYQDIYFLGKEKLFGQEIIYQNNRPIFGMNYFGSVLTEETAGFLKKSLLELSDKCRFGENCEFEKREFKYQDRGQGALEEFSGEEKIFLKGKEIYKLYYRGGLIQK